MEFYDLVDTWATADDQTVVQTLDMMVEQAKKSDLDFITVSPDFWWRISLYLSDRTPTGGLIFKGRTRTFPFVWNDIRVICDDSIGT